MNKESQHQICTLTGHLFREHHGKMVSLLLLKFGYHQIDNVLDALQESFESALKTWKFSGVPNNPVAWLCKVASNNLLNRIKRSKLSQAYIASPDLQETVIHPYNEKEAEDSLLKLLIFFSTAQFTQRHKLIVSLYFLCGLTYPEIASALLLKTETVKKAILRSRQTIKKFAGRYDQFKINSIENLDHVLQVIYLLFNQGYKSSQKNGSINHQTCFEAMKLASLLYRDNPHEGKVNSLLALMSFHSSRFPARTAVSSWIDLGLQDRKLYDRQLIASGFHHLRTAKKNLTLLDRYYIEALISAIHCSSKTYEQTDWKMIAYLYRHLEQTLPYSLLMTLNRIVAESHFKDIRGLLAEIDSTKEPLSTETAFFYHAAKGYCYAKLKEWNLARESYEKSLDYTKNKTDLKTIQEKISSLCR